MTKNTNKSITNATKKNILKMDVTYDYNSNVVFFLSVILHH